MIKLSSFFNLSHNSTTVTAQFNNDVLMRYQVLDILKSVDQKIASHIARMWIKHNRDKVDTWMRHPAVQRRIARSVQQILQQTLKDYP